MKINMVMNNTIILSKLNDVYGKIDGDTSCLKELEDRFKFRVPNFQFTPAYRHGTWNGYIKLFSSWNRRIYLGLLPEVVQYAGTEGWQVRFNYRPDFTKISPEEVIEYIENLQICDDKGERIFARDYQINAIQHALYAHRAIIKSPTGSGKSLIIYTIIRKLLTNTNRKILLIVPKVNLVIQMLGDFKDYAAKIDWNPEDHCHKIYSGQSKETDKRVVISTWQSLNKMPKPFFKDFETVIFDEVHLATAKCTTKIMENLEHCPYRFGTTGTLHDSKTDISVLTGLFGCVFTAISTKELMDRKQLAQLMIYCQVLTYSENEKKVIKKLKYQDEIDFLVGHKQRNRYICELVKSLSGNVLVLFRYVEKHGLLLKEMMEDFDRPVHYIAGSVKSENRENIRQIVSQSDSNVLLASIGSFSVGSNLKGIDSIVFSAPSKSKINILQSIGRGLRVTKTKTSVDLYDIVDDLSVKRHKNHTLKHFLERVKLYNSEMFPYEINNQSFSNLF
jgi:superfamily II DNA or RNA helicase